VLKWLCLFLLLANAILFLWFSLQVEPKQAVVDEEQDGLQQLKLVSEIALPTGSGSVASGKCTLFSGLETEVQAIALVQLIVSEGGKAAYKALGDKRVATYALVISLPQDLQQRLSVLDILEANGHNEIGDELLGYEYVLEGFSEKVAAQDRMAELAKINVVSVVEPRYSIKQNYQVVMDSSIGRNLSNKIKEVVEEEYSLIKIEKKVCEGVAKP